MKEDAGVRIMPDRVVQRSLCVCVCVGGSEGARCSDSQIKLINSKEGKN